MRFYVQTPSDKESHESEFVLVPNSWDDFSHRTSFILQQQRDGGELRPIGTVKIIEKSPKRGEDGKFRPAIPADFDELRPNFVSLGQDEDYYRNLLKFLGREPAGKVLSSLSDISWEPDLAMEFETCPSFRNSLIRFNTANRARRTGRAIILGEAIHDSPAFKYRADIPGASTSCTIEIDFDGDDKIPGRIACLIGRNAVGKTQVLASLATDLTQIAQRSRKELEKREDRFSGPRPLFTRVIAVSYNAFDKFSRSKSVDTGYVYCGLRNEKGVPSISHLTAEYERSINRVIESKRIGTWKSLVTRVLGRRDEAFEEMLEGQEDRSVAATAFLDSLSSGEAILTHLTTALVSWLEPFSLVLFDEPETHLHPNAVASLFNVLSELLIQNESYALIATHSPIVLQEIPRGRVVVLSRNGDITTSAKLDIESFGESLSELTRHVFETNDVKNPYKMTLAALADEESFDQTLDRFGGQLSQNAQAYLLAKRATKRSR